MTRFVGLRAPQLRYADHVAPFEELPMSQRMVLLWQGRSISDVVPEKGSMIKTGQNLARIRTDAFISPATGRVESVTDFQGHDGHPYVAVELAAHADDDFHPSLTVYDEFLDIDPGELLSVIFFMGFAEFAPLMGDSSGPIKPDTLIISAMDRDPLSLVNQQVLRSHASDLARCIALVAHATQTDHVVLAVPSHLNDELPAQKLEGATVVSVPPIYPNGLPELLAVRCGRGPMIGMTPQGVVGNTLVIDLEQAVEMLDCVSSGKPLIHKRITYTESDSGNRHNIKVRIGTPIDHILAHLERPTQPKGKLILNGLLRGYACFSSQQPITAHSESITVQGPDAVYAFESSPCINCGACTAICPTNLQVHLLGRYAEYEFFDKCAELGVAQCVECGLCAYVCPSRRSLVQLLARAKQGLAEDKVTADSSLEEALACNACGPSCPAVRLFDTTPPAESTEEDSDSSEDSEETP